MKVTTFEGIVENGQIRLPAGVHLPEKAKVYVVIPDVEIPSSAYVGSPRLAHPEQAADFKKEVIEEREPGKRLKKQVQRKTLQRTTGEQ